MADRRAKQTGSLYQRCSPERGCPPLVDGERPKHQCRGPWVAVVELPPDGNKRRRKVIVRAKRADAIVALRKVRDELERSGDLRTASLTFDQWVDIWWTKYANLKVSSREVYRNRIELYLRPRLGRMKLDRIGPDQIKDLHHHMSTTLRLSSTTVRGAHFTLSALLRDAHVAGHIQRNPCTVVTAPGRAVYKVKHLTSAEARTLLSSLDPGDGTVPQMLAIASVALLAGPRPEEILGITRDNVDLDAGTITFAWQIKRIAFEHGCGKRGPDKRWPCGRKLGGYCTARHLPVPGDQEIHQLEGGLYLTRPKNRAGFRVVPMVGPLEWVLRRYLETATLGPHGLIFTREGGLPQEPTRIRAKWDAALKAAGVPDVNRHSARHTCNTILAELGYSVDVRSKILGHASRAVNEEVYTHASDTRVREALAAVGGAMDWR